MIDKKEEQVRSEEWYRSWDREPLPDVFAPWIRWNITAFPREEPDSSLRYRSSGITKLT